MKPLIFLPLLLLWRPLEACAMKIYVRTPAGQIAALEVEDADTIDSVKQKIQDQIGVLPARQQLTYADKALEDGRKLQDYSVPGDALLSLALQAAWALESAVFPAGGGAASAGACTLADNAGQACAGVATAASSSLADGFWPTLYAAPVAPGRVSTARPGQPVEISTAKLLAPASDEDGDTLAITAASAASTRGGTVALAGGVIRYTAPAGFSGLDSFAYTVTDSGGDAATGWVTISALAPASANFISAVYASGAPPSMTLKYAGIPGVAYAVQVSTDLASWATVQGSRTVVSASGASAGVASFVHENPPNPTAYYRTVQSP